MRNASRQTRSVAPYARPAREYVRTNGQSIRDNTNDGWVTSNGPVWWLGSDNAFFGAVGPHGPEWGAYGIPPYNGPPIGRKNEWGGGFVKGEWLTGRGILPAVTRATGLIVGPVVNTQWLFTNGTSTDERVPVNGSPINVRPAPLWVNDPQLAGNNPGGEPEAPTLPQARRLGPHDFWSTLLAHAVWFGAGALLYVTDSSGQPLAGTLRVVNPTKWGLTVDGRFMLGPDTDEPLEADFDGTFTVGTVTWHMRVLRGFAPHDGETAGGALTRSGLILSTGETMNNYLNSTLTSGVPAGVLKVSTPNFGQADAENMKQRWMQAHGGSRKSVAVLNAGVDFTPLSLSVVDADLVASKGAWLVDIAHAFGLSAAWLDTSMGSGANLTYANLTDRRRDHVDNSLADWGRGLEDFVSALLPYGVVMRIAWSTYVNTDPAQDMAFVEKALALDLITRQEARERLRLFPADAMETGTGEGKDAVKQRDVAETIQKVYLGVGTVITSDEARIIANRAGAELAVPGPDFTPEPEPAPPLPAESEDEPQ